MNGYKLNWGIINFNDDITSRDAGIPEVYKTLEIANKVLTEKRLEYNSMGYKLWAVKIDEIKVELCICGQYYEIGQPCYYCGEYVVEGTKSSD